MAVASRFTVALHALAFLADRKANNDEYVTSDQIAFSVGTSPVFIRRILGSLRKANLVNVKHGGTDTGWKLSKNPDTITLLNVYNAIIQKPLFEQHHSTPSSQCVIGKGIQPALKQMYDESETAMKQQLDQYSISNLLAETITHYNLLES
ncbi:Rrf2 family transcriptional regulator [Aureibacillus halotolerans]|uniref:BadM/Rrf2 family transcriptional regulator n=1 Tax=Aureibacillus halotolerans TaxID=1508390 RepID=A0A4R6UB86_9BACI|nr:Rrf2 family transcriptional regulator [Aureibacillus halotolerans]TDQ41985.1 BadM/Rrf2 family transcriptional regulator [Aureibacillus halotolerans]